MTNNTEVTVTQALEPCPFCGGKAYLDRNPTANGGMICEMAVCESECAATFFHATQAEAIAAWNTRAQHRTRSVGEAPEPDKLWSALNSALRFAGSRNAITAEEEAGIWAVWNSTRSVGEGEPLEALIERIESLRDERHFPAHLLDATDELLEIAEALKASPKTTDSVDAVREALEAASGMLIRHHQWHTQQRTPDPEHGFIPADEYGDSSLFDGTANALDKVDKALAALQTQPAARDVVVALKDARMFVELVRLRATREGDTEQASEAADSLREIDSALSQPAGEGS